MKDFIFTSWFSGDNGFAQHDHTERCKNDDFSLIEKFYNSIKKNNLNCIIFHNELSDQFINKYSNEKIKFQHHIISNRKSYNDERFFCYLQYLKIHGKEIDKVMCTDCFDVQIHKNPFYLINKKFDIYAGEDDEKGKKWIEQKMTKCNFKIKIKKLYNAGIIGGYKIKLMIFFEEMTEIMSKCPEEINSNMAVFNYMLNSKKWKILSGFPLHNKFRSFDNQGAYIQHK
jgi:hypothetical protein